MFFRQVTMGQVVVVGFNTAQHLPKLFGRTVHIMTRGQTPEEVMAQYLDQDLWIAGGTKTYQLWLPYVRRSYITHIDYDGEADTYMPSLWNIANSIK